MKAGNKLGCQQGEDQQARHYNFRGSAFNSRNKRANLHVLNTLL